MSTPTPLLAYTIGVVVAIVMLIVSSIVSKCISYRPDNTDCRRRKLWFWVFAALSLVFTFMLAFALGYVNIHAASKQHAFLVAMCVASIVSPIIYIVLGFIVSKADKRGKLSNWF